MAQAIRRQSNFADRVSLQVWQRVKEGVFIATGGIALFVLVALWSHHPDDPGWSHTGVGGTIHNHGGVFGAFLADILLYLFGRFAYLSPLMVAYCGWLPLRGPRDQLWPGYLQFSIRASGFLLTLAMGCGLFWVRSHGGFIELPHEAGGIFGDVVGRGLFAGFGQVGGTLLMVALFCTGITVLTGLSWLWAMDVIGKYTLMLSGWCVAGFLVGLDYWRGFQARRERAQVVKEDVIKQEQRVPIRIEPKIVTIEPSARVEKEKQVILFEEAPRNALPALNLLDTPARNSAGYSTEALEAMSRLVELKLKDFGIEATVVAVLPGPVITRFELLPAPGIKASRITGLAKDLARSLSTVSVRVVEVIPGKSVVGLEIPNERREIVSLSEILKSKEYEHSNSLLTMALGKDIAGQPAVVDLARMPHLLVAGTTGSGKSVALNAMILSLLYKASAADVRMIMIDPKMLELSVYEGIPSLLAPVVTDMKEAANALRWCVAEMERRYRLMATLGVRNISGYNRKAEEAIENGTPLADPFYKGELEGAERPTLNSLPHIVVVVDELADMMMTVGKKVEELIARLAQKARAAGIHLILATQRPSVDVITGLIKANIPSRIAFQVSSRVDSRTILDQMGAESLLGNGDMLYLPPGTGIPRRIHGAFVSDQEVHKVVEQLKASGAPEYIDEIVAGCVEGDDVGGAGFDGEEGGGEADELYDQAVKIVTETRRASVSGIQRRLKIGYNRAARMVEEMERAGVVGELQSNGMREVLAPPPPKG
ncbi:MAG: DNA translocase FtsK 4TM domain-containing protein [Gammaproteobacteria bacterium]|nr:DNA translocase FtsK 4TM domain-containing protein [Gammaproteobacteria bacterium]